MADQNLLEVLQAHGQQFLDSFALPDSNAALKKRKRSEGVQIPRKSPKIESISDSEKEWEGIISGDDEPTHSEFRSLEGFEQEDDGFTASSSGPVNSNVVVFQDIPYTPKQFDPTSKTQMKAFMSSKASKLRQDIPGAPDKEKTEEEKEDERTNAQNDAILHRLVHTKLLSGSLNPDLEMTPAQRRKALAGRVLELSGVAKLGKGEKSVREKERNKASKRVREGLVGKQKEKARQELEEAKDLGNYHPTIKKLFETSDSRSSRKRERGLKMGVGTFRGGYLRLSRDEISMVEGGGSQGLRGGGGRNRGRGRGR